MPLRPTEPRWLVCPRGLFFFLKCITEECCQKTAPTPGVRSTWASIWQKCCLPGYLRVVKLSQPALDPSGSRWKPGEARFSTRLYSQVWSLPPPWSIMNYQCHSLKHHRRPPPPVRQNAVDCGKLHYGGSATLSKYSYGRACANVCREMSVTTTAVSSLCGTAGRYRTHASSSE